MHDIPDGVVLFEGRIALETKLTVAFHIPDWDGPGTGFEIIDAVAFIDTLTLYCRKPLPRNVIGDLRRRFGGRIFPEKRYAKRLRRPYWTITIHQPDLETLALLRILERKKLIVVSSVHIAVDFLTADDRQARHATEYLRRSVLLKWRYRGHRSQLKLNTAYSNVDNNAKRNSALYGDRLSKPCGRPCAHLEMRFTGAEACKRAGVGDLAVLINGVDALAFLKHQTAIRPINAKRLDRTIEKFARLNLRRRRRPNMTVGDIKKELQRIYARILQDADQSLDAATTLAKARSQKLWDYRRELRSCLDRVPWESFTPPPRWLPWRCVVSNSTHIMAVPCKQLIHLPISRVISGKNPGGKK